MEYPKLNQQLEKDKTRLIKQVGSNRDRLGRELLVLGKHMETLSRAAGRLEPQEFEHYNDLAENDPKSAELFLAEKAHVEKRLELKQKKSELVEGLRLKIEALVLEQSRLSVDQARLENLNPVSDQLKNPDFLAAFQISKTSVDWPNCAVDTFSKLYGARDKKGHRIQFLPTATGRYGLMSKRDIPVDLVPVDPERFSEPLLEELGLAQFPMELGDVDRLVRKAESVPGMRRFFDSLQPLTRLDQNRQPIPNPRISVVSHFNPDLDGALFATFHHGGDDQRKVAHLYKSIYPLYRSTLHVQQGYKDEAVTVLDVKRRLQSLHLQSLGFQKGDPHEAQAKEALKQTILSEAEKLYLCRNRFKASARDALSQLRDLKDSLGRENIGAARARLLSVIRFVEARSPEIFSKRQYKDVDQQFVKDTLDQGESTLDGAYDTLVGVFDRLKRSPAAPFTPERQAEFIRRSLLEPLSQAPKVRPFSLYIAHLQAQLSLLMDAIRSGDRGAQLLPVKKSLGLLLLFRLQKQVERLIAGLSLMEDPQFQLLAKHSAPLFDWAANAGQNLPEDNPLSAFPGALQSIIPALKQCASILKNRTDQPQSSEVHEEHRLQLKSTLESIDFASILQSL